MVACSVCVCAELEFGWSAFVVSSVSYVVQVGMAQLHSCHAESVLVVDAPVSACGDGVGSAPYVAS